MWCNTLLQCVWWIASWAEDEQLQGKNSLLSLGALVLGGGSVQDEIQIRMSSSCLLLWWLVLFIEALVLSPNIEQEGIQQRPNLKGGS